MPPYMYIAVPNLLSKILIVFHYVFFIFHQKWCLSHTQDDAGTAVSYCSGKNTFTEFLNDLLVQQFSSKYTLYKKQNII
jgi:hypothetical protein